MSPEKSPYKALEKFSKAVYGTTGGTCSARDFRPLMGWRRPSGLCSVPEVVSGHCKDLRKVPISQKGMKLLEDTNQFLPVGSGK